MSGECSTHSVKRNAYTVLVRKPEGKRPLGKPGRRWEYESGSEKQEGGGGRGVDLYGSGLGQVAGCCVHDNEPLSPIKCWEFLHWFRHSYLLKKDSASLSYLVGCLVNNPAFANSTNLSIIPSSWYFSLKSYISVGLCMIIDPISYT